MFTNCYLNYISATYLNTGYTVTTSTYNIIYIMTSTFLLSVNRMMKIPLSVLLARYIRGSGGVAIFWRKSLSNAIQKLPLFSHNMVAAIQVRTVPRPLCILSVYLPSWLHGQIFKEALDFLDSAIEVLSTDNDVIILGDLNADPGDKGGPNSTTPVNEQGSILLRYLTKWEYASVHLTSPLSNVPSHTYHSDAHSSYSTLDHILAPSHLLSIFRQRSMLDDDPLNLSDHLPVSASVSCALHHFHHSAGIKKQEPKKLKRNWSKLSRDVVRESYTATVNDNLVRINLPDSKTLSQQPSLIDSHLTKLTNILCETAEDTIPAKRFLPHLKPEWSAELSGAHAASKLAYKA